MTPPTPRPVVGMLIYANPDHYPPTVNAVHLLARSCELRIVGRNMGTADRSYPRGVRIERLGSPGSARDRERASAAAKLSEYAGFIVRAATLLSDADVLYAYDAFAFVAACLLQMASSHPPALIYQSHEIEHELPPLSTLRGWVVRLERAWARRADLIVFPDAERAARFARTAALERPPLVVPNYPLRELFAACPDLDKLIPQRLDHPVVLYRGTISGAAAAEEIVRATALLRPPTKTLLVGFPGGFSGNELAQLAEAAGVAQRCSYAGILPYADLQPLTLAAAVGLSLYKGTTFDRAATTTAANKIYEYAACGLPVVVSDLPGYRKVFEHATWIRFANPFDPASIAKAVQALLDDPQEYARACRDARTAFETNLTYEIAFAPVLEWIREHEAPRRRADTA